MSAELLHLLETEDELIASTIRESHGRIGVSNKYGEEFGEYHAQVFELCLKRCGKAGLVRVMVHNARQGSESRGTTLELIATVFDQGFSDEQRDQLSGALVSGATDTTSAFNRYFAMNGIGRMLQTTLVSPQRREDMHRAVIANVTDPLTDNRSYAVQTLAKFRDARDRPLLTAIAGNDTARTVSRGKTVYPVRGAALAALEKLPPP